MAIDKELEDKLKGILFNPDDFSEIEDYDEVDDYEYKKKKLPIAS